MWYDSLIKYQPNIGTIGNWMRNIDKRRKHQKYFTVHVIRQFIYKWAYSFENELKQIGTTKNPSNVVFTQIQLDKLFERREQ